MNFVEEFSYKATVKPPISAGNAGAGERMIFEVLEGTVTGERVKGKFVGPGADWGLAGADGFMRLDVRSQIETHDGAIIFLHYTGLLEMNEKAQNALATATGTNYGDQYFYTNPRFETGDERYKWMTSTFWVGQGHVIEGLGVEYRVFRAE